MIKTINLNGSEVKVKELGGDNTEIFNNGNDTIYASKLPNITAGGDEVIAIPAGASDGLYGTGGTVYLLGTGSVELRGNDKELIIRTRGQSSTSGSSDITSVYVDTKCEEILETAKAYADIKDSEVIVSVKEYADEKDNEILDSAKEYAYSLNAELAGYIGYTDDDIYGLEADFENCVFTRLAGAVGKTAGADFNSIRAYGSRRRCNLSDDGEVLAYYSDENFKADGSNGQVMVEQPKFYYRVVPLKTEKIDNADGYYLRKARYYISDTPKPGFKVHPAFNLGGTEADKIYLSAFEGSIYDCSAEMYLSEDEQISDFNVDKLASVANAQPCSGQSQALTIANARKLARNRGKGWEQMTVYGISVTQLLFIIEYASFNSQNVIGIGATSKTDKQNSNISEICGDTLSLGNLSGAVYNSNNYQFISYRGEENLWGNINNIIDGIVGYKSNEFAAGQKIKMYMNNSSNNPDDYVYIGSGPEYGQGYMSSFIYYPNFDWLFCAGELNGNSALPTGDFIWNVGKGFWASVVQTGGISLPASEKNSIGLFARNYNSGLSVSARNLGVRLTYFPNALAS